MRQQDRREFIRSLAPAALAPAALAVSSPSGRTGELSAASPDSYYTDEFLAGLSVAGAVRRIVREVGPDIAAPDGQDVAIWQGGRIAAVIRRAPGDRVEVVRL